MRILMLNNEFPPLGGGTGTVTQAILQRLRSNPNIEVDLITSARGKLPEEESLAENIRINKLPVNNRNIHHASNRELMVYALRALFFSWKKHHKHPYQVCFAWSAVPAGAVAWALRGLTGLPYIVRVSGPDIPGFERRYGPLYPVLTPLIRSVWRRAEKVVAKCETEVNMIRAVEQHLNVEIIPNGVDADVFQPRESFFEEGPLRLICVGRLIERKGQHYLIEALKRLIDEGKDITLELVGTGDAEAANKAMARRFGLDRHIHFAGYVPREEIAHHYQSAHVFVLASYNEGMSVATLEAMAAGLAIIITRTGGTEELVEEGINGYTFNWADVDTLTDHLRRLASDRPLVRRLGSFSRRRAETFSWNGAVSRYQEMFERMIHQRHSE